MKEEPTPSQLAALEKLAASRSRTLTRVLGGWTTIEIELLFNPQRAGDRPEWFVTTNTVEAMLRCGWLESFIRPDGAYRRTCQRVTKLGLAALMRYRQPAPEIRCRKCGGTDVEHVDGVNPVEVCRSCKEAWSAES